MKHTLFEWKSRSFSIILLLALSLFRTLQGYEVLSLSSAIIDNFFFLNDTELRTITNEKGSWAPIDDKTLHFILNRHQSNSRMIIGGSGINVLKGLSHLGVRCAVIGKIGADDLGYYYQNMLKKLGIFSFLAKGIEPTGQALCFITPDGQRTFRTYLGASHGLGDIKIDPALFKGIKLFHVEGYQLIEEELVLLALECAKNANVKISMDLGNAKIVKEHKSFIINILPKYVDILFCNEDEAEELVGMNPSDACTSLSAFCGIAVVTMGDKGCWAQKGMEKVFTPALSVNAIDTTGAGDLFASGFIHGYLCGKSLKQCSSQGSLVASYVVKVIGTDISEQNWTEIHSLIRE